MICPTCGHRNLPGADWCEWCQFALMAVDRPAPLDRVDRSLMTDPVTVLEPRPAILLPADAGLGLAVDAMMARGIGAVFVTDPAGRIVGILTERDFLTKIVGEPGYESLPIGQFMTRHPETVKPNDTLAFALGKMAGGGYRHLPVVVDGVPVGMVSVRDVLRHVVKLCSDA
ncbi:MAG: CBS domain-containing protein [Fimbriiglobus sp.]